MQQRACVRRQLVTPRSNNDQCTPVNISKGIILRNNLYTHVLATFPKHAAMITRYGSATYYHEKFGVDENGVMSDPPDADRDPDGDAGGDVEADNGPTSSYKSRAPLERFLKSLMSNKLERVICSMVKSSQGGHNTLDLAADDANQIMSRYPSLHAWRGPALSYHRGRCGRQRICSHGRDA